MSRTLDISRFPLRGSQLIEASAGTGKTFTIALLYTRLILQHGGDDERFTRALSPEQILVVTFTDAATQELRDRIRARLAAAARCFMPEAGVDEAGIDAELRQLREGFAPEQWPQCARRLTLAAQAMDQSAVSTIHSWCYRMLREHAFDSGSLFQQELVSSQREVLDDLTRDYWRQHFYVLNGNAAALVQQVFSTPDALLKAVRPLLNKSGARLSFAGRTLTSSGHLWQALQQFVDQQAQLEAIEDSARQQWLSASDELDAILDQWRPVLNLQTFNEAKSDDTFTELKLALREWARGGERPKRIQRFAQDQWKLKKAGKDVAAQPEHPALAAIARLCEQEQALAGSDAPDVRASVLAHAVVWMEQALAQRLQQKAELGFDDLLLQLDRALQGPRGEQLAVRIRAQFPVAMIDEFQDTDPLQYRIFDRIYRIADSDGSTRSHAIIMIGDPKQAIYSFRHADIHTYLQARNATADRHYNLGTNYRSSQALVSAVNHLFSHADQWPAGAFRFRTQDDSNRDDPLPFLPVKAKGRPEQLIIAGEVAPAMHLWHLQAPENERETFSNGAYVSAMASRCASVIADLLLNPNGDHGFRDASQHSVRPVRPGDIAILVRNRNEADEIRGALFNHRLASVYLSDRESVFSSLEASDLLRWLRACAEPGDERKLRAALATVSLDMPLAQLQQLALDELLWEEHTVLFRELNRRWRQQGVLPMLRILMQHYELPTRLMQRPDGERRLTNLLHLAEVLQRASQQYDGEQALIRYLAEQIQNPDEEEILRLESDEDLIRVVTIHKSKGLEYPLVFLPFICTSKPVDGSRDSVLIVDEQHPGQRRLEVAGNKLADAAWQRADEERLAEDLRLLYVAVTRACHAVWLGMAAVGRGNTSSLHLTAPGYVLAGGATLDAAGLGMALKNLAHGCSHIVCEQAPEISAVLAPQAPAPKTPASKPALVSQRPPLAPWWIASYSALKTGTMTMAVQQASDDQVAEEVSSEQATAVGTGPAFSRFASGLHGFHRGPGPGTFLHNVLEWACNTGFATAAADSAARLQHIRSACDIRGWQDDVQRLDQWLGGFITTTFRLDQQIHINLCELAVCQAELEFLFASHAMTTSALDAACQRYLSPGRARPALLPTQLNGMIKGFIDLVFEHNGRYFVADWKSNYLGPRDEDYSPEAMTQEVLLKRYDVQYALYLLALHRLLRSRLPDYDYNRHIGGAVYFFLRGWQAPSQGIVFDKPPEAFIEQLDQLFLSGQHSPTIHQGSTA